MSSIANVKEYLDGFNFTGGYPTSKDLAPSIIFTIFYAILLPLFVWRVVRRSDRTWLLVRPGIFLAVRIGTYVLRAVMAKTNYGQDQLIAELVLVSIGFLFIISPLLDMWQRQVDVAVPRSHRPFWFAKLVRLSQLVLLAAIIIAIVGSSSIGGSSSQTTINTLRRASYILSLAVVVLALFGAAYTHFHFGLGSRGTSFLIVECVLCLIVAVYRVVQIFDSNPDAPVRNVATFYVLQGAMEWFALLGVLVISIPEWFPGAAPSTQAVTKHEV